MLDHILKKCKLLGKIDLPYIPETNANNLNSMFIYVSAIKFANDKPLLSKLALQLSKLCKIDYEKCVEAMSVDSTILEKYAVELAYYCSVDTLRLQELLIKCNIVGDYIQLAKMTSITISNVFMNAIGCLVKNFYRRNASKQDMLYSIVRKGIPIIGNKYEGALVLEEKKTDQPVGVLDFESMYSNAIIEKIYQTILV